MQTRKKNWKIILDANSSKSEQVKLPYLKVNDHAINNKTNVETLIRDRKISRNDKKL